MRQHQWIKLSDFCASDSATKLLILVCNAVKAGRYRHACGLKCQQNVSKHIVGHPNWLNFILYGPVHSCRGVFLIRPLSRATQIARFMGPAWGPPGSCRPQMGPMLAPCTLLSGNALGPVSIIMDHNRWHYAMIVAIHGSMDGGRSLSWLCCPAAVQYEETYTHWSLWDQNPRKQDLCPHSSTRSLRNVSR